MNKKIILVISGIILIGIVAILGYVFLRDQESSVKYSAPIQTEAITNIASSTLEKVDEHLSIDSTLRDVSFCETTHRVKQVFIDGVDVVQRIAELVSADQMIRAQDKLNLSKSICSNIEANVSFLTQYYDPALNEIRPHIESSVDSLGHQTYDIYIVTYGFRVDTVTHDIYVDSPIGGGPELTTAKLSTIEKVDDHLTINNAPRDINFCGTTYQAKQIVIDGVDVMQRIAEITNTSSTQDQKAICGNITYGIDPGHELDVRGGGHPVGDSNYYIGVGRWMGFIIGYPSLQISISKEGEGSPSVIGTLK